MNGNFQLTTWIDYKETEKKIYLTILNIPDEQMRIIPKQSQVFWTYYLFLLYYLFLALFNVGFEGNWALKTVHPYRPMSAQS